MQTQHLDVGARSCMSAQRSWKQFEFSINFDKPNQMHVGARSSVKKCQVVSDQERLRTFDISSRATICEAKSIKPPQDNDRDNRVAAQRCVVSGADDKIGVSQSSAERCFRKRKPRLRFIALLYSHYPFRAVLPRHQETAECDGGL